MKEFKRRGRFRAAMPDVETRREGAVAIVTLNRPPVYNAFTLAMARDLRAALGDLVHEPAVGAIVLTGAGSAFCSGGDVAEMDANLARAHDHFLDLTAEHHAIVRLLVEGPKPVVCAVNGVAAGGGFGLALCGDIRIASEAARFKPAYFRLGVAPDGGSTWLLPRLVGFTRAQELLYHDRVVDAQEAMALGLVHEVAPAAALMRRALEEASALAQGPPFALAAAKKLLAETTSNDVAQQLALERRLNSESGATADFAEGARAFREKRAPRFRQSR
ncbi:MAG: 2-(1,2-epoxy,2-dihydrophenyl)acetyl-CoA isomerase [Thermoplasmata archaeon]|jgi:2-(1,2-epoxy-1,2-dihydrophenyl)acetyl-CoA isomerase|nr:2-(1,2-epoxy,2-dihydrophenyl)acetyl-CoA isomerase [Thermoplasmata archaeon]